jgi:hypothetical protein
MESWKELAEEQYRGMCEQDFDKATKTEVSVGTWGGKVNVGEGDGRREWGTGFGAHPR